MCCFTAHAQVANTQIFARGNGPTQLLAYRMEYEAANDLAMVLPLPTPPNAAEEAVRFIDLSGYENFFDDLQLCFVSYMPTRGWGLSLEFGFQPATLKVHHVGSFEASFVPQRSQFQRLDPRFRLDEGVWDQLPQYADYGFAVFKLKAGARHVHPMAFEFPRRDPSQLFFPTVHIHHRVVEPVADFDHVLFYQLGEDTPVSLVTHNPRPGATFRREEEEIAPKLRELEFLELEAAELEKRRLELYDWRAVEVERTQGLIDPTQILRLIEVKGAWPNQDIVLQR